MEVVELGGVTMDPVVDEVLVVGGEVTILADVVYGHQALNWLEVSPFTVQLGWSL